MKKLLEVTPAQMAHAAALAEPEQEPVAWMVYTLDGNSVCVTDNPSDFTDGHRALPLYTHPPRREWRGLTEEERDAVIRWAVDQEDTHFSRTVARAVEAKLKEKNQ